MVELCTLSELFHPVQPRFREHGKSVSYRELPADKLLSGYISCYWELKSLEPLLHPINYTAVADGCVDFFFDLNNPGENFVMGFSTEHTTFTLNNYFNYAGVRFFPGAFASLFGIRASELTNQCVHIHDVMSGRFETIQMLGTGIYHLADFKSRFDEYIGKILFSESEVADPRFIRSLYHILKSESSIHVEKDLNAEVSSRQLRRLFDFYIGASPKHFNKIIRFQKFLQRNTSRECLKKEKTYFDLGYYDQSHFIRDFKSLYGISPLKAFPR